MQGISVIIPAYGRVPELCRAIESVVTAYPDHTEIVVIDDHSPESITPYVPTQTAGGVAVRVVRLSRNRGAGIARAFGVRRARFNYVAFLDSDDAFAADKVDVLRTRIETTGADVIIHPVAGTETYNRIMDIWDRLLRRVLPFHWLIVLLNPIPTPGLTVKRLRRLGHPTLRHAEDWAFLLRYVDRDTQVEYIPQQLASVHRPIGSAGGLSEGRSAMRKGEFIARRLLLRSKTPSNFLRFCLGSTAGIARLVVDQVRQMIRS